MNDKMKMVMYMKRYIDRTEATKAGRTHFDFAELLAVGEYANTDFFGAILLALNYGYAKGHRDTKAGVSV